MTGRSVEEWIGKTPDSKVPPRVRLRIFRNANGVCHISGRKIVAEPWEIEHVIPLSMGGEHRESNLRPALADKHKAKSAREAKDRARADAAAKRHTGARGRVSTMPSREMPVSEQAAERAAKREPKQPLKPKVLFA